MKFFDEIMDAMGIVDEVEEEEVPHKSREERMAKAEAAKAAKEEAEGKVSATDRVKGLFKKKETTPEEVKPVVEIEEEKKEPARRRLNFSFAKNAEPKEESTSSQKEQPAAPKAKEPVRRSAAPVAPAVNFGAVNMQMVEPTSFDDSQKVADCLHNNQPVIVNFEKTDPIVAKRMTDFISGTIYALQGNMKKIGKNILICAPKNIDIDSGLGMENRGDDSWKQ